MRDAEGVLRLIEQGKLSQDEGLKLVGALEAAEARDHILREELRARSATRQPVACLMAAVVGLIGLGAIAGAVGVSGMRQTPNAPQPVRTEAMQEPAAGAQARAEWLERSRTMRTPGSISIVAFVIVIVAGILGWILMLQNSLARRDEQVNERWAQVEAVLQRRLDLVPQLVETVKGYAAHERQTLVEVTEARARALGILQATGAAAPKSAETLQQLQQAEQSVAAAMGKLLALAEQYPAIKASSNFLTLQEQLEGTENRISVERQRYNDAVRAYNASLRVFPSNVVGGMFGYEPRVYFQAKPGAESPAPVQF